MGDKLEKRVNIVVNILLGIIVLAFIIGTIYSVIKFNAEHQSLQSMGYNQDLIDKIENKNLNEIV